MRKIKITMELETNDKDLEAEFVAECESLADEYLIDCEVDINPEENE